MELAGCRTGSGAGAVRRAVDGVHAGVFERERISDSHGCEVMLCSTGGGVLLQAGAWRMTGWCGRAGARRWRRRVGSACSRCMDQDAERLQTFLKEEGQDGGSGRGGYIGLEMATALRARGLKRDGVSRGRVAAGAR